MRALPTGGAGGFGNKQPIILGKGAGPPVPGTAMKRGIGTAAGGGGGARPMTAVSGAGFNSNKNIGASMDNSAITVTLEPKIET